MSSKRASRWLRGSGFLSLNLTSRRFCTARNLLPWSSRSWCRAFTASMDSKWASMLRCRPSTERWSLKVICKGSASSSSAAA